MTELFISFILGVLIGWVISAGTIGDECKNLGGFYLGSVVYKCEAIK